ncbi:hypothetical protein C8R44DRAFT_938148 [Mycena epipterygia]|nr:hypothetical protein C8R44DRAFT_938148 [Mycena epipterygia]
MWVLFHSLDRRILTSTEREDIGQLAPESTENPPNTLPLRSTCLPSTYDTLFSIDEPAGLSADTNAPPTCELEPPITSSPSESLRPDSPSLSLFDPSRPFKYLQAECPLWFKREYTRRVHMNIYLPCSAKDQKFPFTFDGCSMLFSRKQDRLRHEDTPSSQRLRVKRKQRRNENGLNLKTNLAGPDREPLTVGPPARVSQGYQCDFLVFHRKNTSTCLREIAGSLCIEIGGPPASEELRPGGRDHNVAILVEVPALPRLTKNSTSQLVDERERRDSGDRIPQDRGVQYEEKKPHEGRPDYQYAG